MRTFPDSYCSVEVAWKYMWAVTAPFVDRLSCCGKKWLQSLGLQKLLRSIRSIYEFIHDLKHAQKEIENIGKETYALQQCLLELELLKTADEETRAIVQQIGLPQAVTHCGDACVVLQQNLQKWTAARKQNWLVKV